MLDSAGLTSGFPHLYYSGLFRKKLVLVMERVGYPLQDLVKKKGQVGMRTAAHIFIQVLSRLRDLHSIGIIHADLNIKNIMIDEGPSGRDYRQVRLIDFGISVSYLQDGCHVQNRTTGEVRGHVLYASVHAHEKAALSRRDDLEQLAYVFVKMVHGALPWERMLLGNGEGAWKNVGKKKREWSKGRLWHGLPTAVKECMQYIFSLRFEESPDYRWIQQQMRKLM